MRFSRAPVVASVISAAACGLAVDVYGWEIARLWLIPALSIIAAAVLVRLARGLPITNPDHVQEDDVDEVAATFTSLARSLRTLFWVALITMVAVGLAAPLAELLARLIPVRWDYGNRAGSALVGLLVSFTFSRMLQIAQSDVTIADLQVRLLREAVARRAAKKFAEDTMQPTTFRQPEGYGKPLQ
ncbi:MAG: hypothetical protein QM608_00785 [Caulobacter sp.]